MKTLKTFIGAIVLAAAALPALAAADGRNASINERQQQIEQRMHQGWRSGELTRREYRRLQHELRLIERDEYAFRSDGHLSPRERQHLHARLDAVSRDVWAEKHDGDRRHAHYNERHDADRRF